MADAFAFLQGHPWLTTILSVAALILGAVLANFVVKQLILRIIRKLLGRTAYGRDEELSRHDVARRLANAMPALVVALGVELVPGLPAVVVTVVQNVANAFIILTIAVAIGIVLDIVDTIYHRREEARRKPIKGLLQIGKIGVFVFAAVLVVATIIDQSPVIFLSGFGAMAAVLILVFQDTLLGLVAGVQISQTDMVRVGDWIEMPGQDANGDVVEIALHTVKIRNFDRTIASVPIRKLVTEPFKNWRGMQESGGRRIKRSLHIDQGSIRFLDSDEIERLSQFDLLTGYMAEKKAEISAWNQQLGERAAVSGNTRRKTNIGTFRAYVGEYLARHPGVHQGMTLMVRQLEPGPQGLPLEVYCFANTVVWTEYEAIQADLFDHLYSIMPEFGLRVFQAPGGADLLVAGQSGAGASLARLASAEAM